MAFFSIAAVACLLFCGRERIDGRRIGCKGVNSSHTCAAVDRHEPTIDYAGCETDGFAFLYIGHVWVGWSCTDAQVHIDFLPCLEFQFKIWRYPGRIVQNGVINAIQ